VLKDIMEEFASVESGPSPGAMAEDDDDDDFAFDAQYSAEEVATIKAFVDVFSFLRAIAKTCLSAIDVLGNDGQFDRLHALWTAFSALEKQAVDLGSTLYAPLDKDEILTAHQGLGEVVVRITDELATCAAGGLLVSDIPLQETCATAKATAQATLARAVGVTGSLEEL
jgi:hypothetical protein